MGGECKCKIGKNLPHTLLGLNPGILHVQKEGDKRTRKASAEHRRLCDFWVRNVSTIFQNTLIGYGSTGLRLYISTKLKL